GTPWTMRAPWTGRRRDGRVARPGPRFDAVVRSRAGGRGAAGGALAGGAAGGALAGGAAGARGAWMPSAALAAGCVGGRGVGLAERARGGRAACAPGRERREDGGVEGPVDRGGVATRRLRLTQRRARQGRSVLAFDEPAQRQRLPEHGAQGVDVRAPVHRLAA